MKRTLLILLIGVLCALMAAMMVVAGAYSGLATATAWQRVLEATVFVVAVGGWLTLAAFTWAPRLAGPGASAVSRLGVAAVAVLIASALWMAVFRL